MSGGLRTSVKSQLLAQRASTLNPSVENEIINNTGTAPPDSPPLPAEEMTMDSTAYMINICGGNILCFPILSPAAKSVASYRTRTRAESPPPQGVNLNSSAPSVSAPSSPQREGAILQSNLKNFHFNELKTATRNFCSDSVLSEGHSGRVFKGWIDEHSLLAAKPGTGIAVVIKKLYQPRTSESHKEFVKEGNCLGQLSHPNLVKVIGYCLEDDMQLLVFEFMSKGSLEYHLFRRCSGFQILSWNLRVKIALGAAKALAFLHSDEAKCIFLDLKTSKILLDSEYNVKVYGHGFNQETPEGYRTRLLDENLYNNGLPWYEDCLFPNRPYTAPEYIAADHLTPRSDVYSFGVVLLEILSGRQAIDINRPMTEQDLVRFAKGSTKRTFHRIIDPRMEGNYPKSGAFKAVELAIQCVSPEPKCRPDMQQVVEILENLQSSGTSQNESGQNLQGNSSNSPEHHRNRNSRRPKATTASHPTASVS